MWPYPWTHVGTPSHLGHMDRLAATMPSQAHAGAAQEAPDIGQWEGQDVPLVRPSSCNVKGGIPSSRRYLPTYLVCTLRLYPAAPGCRVRCGCVCLGSCFGCAPPPLTGVLGCVCVFVCTLRLYPATPGGGVRCRCACLGSGLGCALLLLAGLLGFLCVCLRALLVPRHSWLRCEVWVCVLGLGFRLCHATPCRADGVCVCSCVRSSCTPPLLAEVCGAGVCAWARVLSAPRHSWLGCWGVCVCVRPVLVPHHSWL